MYKHIVVKENTKKRFDDAVWSERKTQDEFLNSLLEIWEGVEAGVLKVTPK